MRRCQRPLEAFLRCTWRAVRNASTSAEKVEKRTHGGRRRSGAYLSIAYSAENPLMLFIRVMSFKGRGKGKPLKRGGWKAVSCGRTEKGGEERTVRGPWWSQGASEKVSLSASGIPLHWQCKGGNQQRRARGVNDPFFLPWATGVFWKKLL